MAVAVVPKSEFRRNENVIVGYGEVPSVIDQNGRSGWGLPGGKIVYTVFEAKAYAKKLDDHIRKNMRNVSQLLAA